MEARSLHSLRSVEMTETNPVEMTEKGSLVIPCQPPFVIPGLTGNLSRWQSGQLTVRHQNGEKHDGRSRFGVFCLRFRHRPTGNRPKSCRTVSVSHEVGQSEWDGRDWPEWDGCLFRKHKTASYL